MFPRFLWFWSGSEWGPVTNVRWVQTENVTEQIYHGSSSMASASLFVEGELMQINYPTKFNSFVPCPGKNTHVACSVSATQQQEEMEKTGKWSDSTASRAFITIHLSQRQWYEGRSGIYVPVNAEIYYFITLCESKHLHLHPLINPCHSFKFL